VDASWSSALGKIPSGLFILTARHGDHETGMLASWVQQCSFEPPLLTVAVKSGRFLLDWLLPEAPFAINILPDSGKAFVAHFGKGFEPGEPAFEGIGVDRYPGLAPVLTAALAVLHCRVVKQLETSGDHRLIVGQVLAGQMLHEGKPAIHIRKSGLHY